MFSESTPKGICATCRHMVQCPWFMTNVKNGAQVLWCEEFDSSGIQSGSRRQKIIHPHIGKPPRPANGICANCNDSQFCKFPASNMGIHFCEEFYSGVQCEINPRRSIDSDRGYPNFNVKTMFPGWTL